jgi:ATP-dependent Zn protease
VREANTVVNVMLQELESFNGVVILATNLAANFDPAFERRIRTHVLFEMPDAELREQIWRVQMHPTLTPLADDVDFRSLADRYPASGGDIRNAVLKAALAAASGPGMDAAKMIHHQHLEDAIRDVLAGKRVMQQSLFKDPSNMPDSSNIDALETLARGLQPSAMPAFVIGALALVVSIAALVVALVR